MISKRVRGKPEPPASSFEVRTQPWNKYMPNKDHCCVRICVMIDIEGYIYIYNLHAFVAFSMFAEKFDVILLCLPL